MSTFENDRIYKECYKHFCKRIEEEVGNQMPIHSSELKSKYKEIKTFV